MELHKNNAILAMSVYIAALLLGYCFRQEDNITPTTEEQVSKPISRQAPLKDSAPANLSVPASKAAAKNAAAVQKTKQPAAATPPQELTEQPAAKHCPECTERILEFLSDPANSEADKVAACKDWAKPETKDETLSLLRLLKEAHDAQQNDLKDRLLQILAGADGSEFAELLIAVINGEMPELVFQEFPEDLQYAIKKGIRLNPESEKIGKALADNYNSQQISPEAAAMIQDVKHPDMIYQLALEADQHGEIEEVRELVQSLQTFADSRTLDVIIRLGKEQIVTEEDAIKSAYA